MKTSILLLSLALAAPPLIHAQPAPTTALASPAATYRPLGELAIDRNQPLGQIDAKTFAQFQRDIGAASVITQPVDPQSHRAESLVDAATVKKLTNPTVGSPTAATATVYPAVLDTRINGFENAKLYRRNQTTMDVHPTSQAVALQSGDVLAVDTDTPASILRQSNGGALAASTTILYALDKASRPRALGLVIRSTSLSWVPKESSFVGTLLVGLIDRDDARAHESLSASIPIQLLAEPGTLDRTDLDINRIGAPFEHVTVKSDGGDDPFNIKFVSQIDPDVPAADLPVARRRVAITGPSAIPGFGVGSAEITVSGVGAPLSPGQAFTLDADNGWLTSRTLVVDKLGVAGTRLRSTGIGAGTLMLALGPYKADPKKITFYFPWLFLTATILGAALGAIVSVYRLKRAAPRSRRRYVSDWLVGLIIGVGATAMAYAGMHLPEWIPIPEALVGEVAPFALAFICSAASVFLIESIIPFRAATDGDRHH